MSPLQKSYLDEAKRIEARRSVWVPAAHGDRWYHTYDHEIVKGTIIMLRKMAGVKDEKD